MVIGGGLGGISGDVRLKLVLLRHADGMVTHHFLGVTEEDIRTGRVYEKVLAAYGQISELGAQSFVEADLPNGRALISQMSLRKYVELHLPEQLEKIRKSEDSDAKAF